METDDNDEMQYLNVNKSNNVKYEVQLKPFTFLYIYISLVLQ